jgi:hypothetical protein
MIPDTAVAVGYAPVVLSDFPNRKTVRATGQGCPRVGDGSSALALGIPRFAGRSRSITINSPAHRHISATSPISRALFKPAINLALLSCLIGDICNPHRINRPQIALNMRRAEEILGLAEQRRDDGKKYGPPYRQQCRRNPDGVNDLAG